jgi:hypothetical protein
MARSIAFLTVAALVLGTAGGARAADPVNVADIGAVTLTSGQVPFILSLNDDHDDGAATADFQRNGAPPSAKDDNLRELRFVPPAGGNFVVVYAPLNVATGKPAIDDKIRGWDEPKKAVFRFGTAQATATAKPLVLYMEGIKQTVVDGVGFEFAYFKDQAMKQPVGGGSGLLTVVTVSLDRAGGGRGLAKNEKLLATGELTAVASVAPRVPSARYAWDFSNATTGRIVVAKDPLRARFTAANRWTALLGQDRVIFTITDTRQAAAPIVATTPINVTAPRTVQARPAALNPLTIGVSAKGLVNAKQVDAETFTLFRWIVTYPVFDQFNAPIYDSDKGDTSIRAFVREDVPISSPVPGLQNYLSQIRTTPAWKVIKDDGTFFDNLNLKDISMSAVLSTTPGHFSFVTGPTGTTIITLPHHVWHVTLNQDPTLDKTVTDNQLAVVSGAITRVNNSYEETTYTSRYTINTTP